MLAYIYKSSKKEKAQKIVGEFIPTKKNVPAKDFYKDNGFKMNKKEKDSEIWEFSTNKVLKFLGFIKITEK